MGGWWVSGLGWLGISKCPVQLVSRLLGDWGNTGAVD